MVFNRLGAGLIVSAALLLAGPAAAQDQTPKPAPGRDGFLIGFSFGFGASYPCDTCAGFGGDFHVGAFAKKNLAVLFELGAVGADEREEGLALATISVQYWPSERFWVRGGVGMGGSFIVDDFDDFDDDVRTDERGWGGSAAVGYEIARKGRFAFDVQLRGATATGRTSVGLNLGFHWY
jgi:hypothetical protein